MKLRFEDLAPSDVYETFFNALRDKDGVIRILTIDGKKKAVFVLNRNPFNKKVVFALESLSIYQVETYLGRIVDVKKLLDINQARGTKNNRLREELENISQKIADDLKSKFIENLKSKKIERKPKVFKSKTRKPEKKPKKLKVRRSIAK